MPAALPPLPKDKRALIHQISANLAADVERQIKQLPEDVFVYHFLPMFCGEQGPTDVTPSLWEQIAGNAFLPIDVTDTKTAEVIYRVPSLYDMEGLEVGKRDPRASPMTHVLITMSQLSKQSPHLGLNYLHQQLAWRNLTHVSPELTKRIEQLNIIFKRYNKPLIALSEDGSVGIPATGPVDSSLTSVDSPGLLYD